MTLKNVVSGNVHHLFCQPMDEKIQTWPLASLFSRQRKLWYWEGIVRLANRIAVWSQSEVSVKFQKGFRHEVFFTRAFVQPAKSYPRLYPFNKPIKSLYFRSFVVSFFFARFPFKDMRKSLYRSDFTDSLHRIVQVYQGRRHVFQIQRIISVLILKIRWYKDWRIQLY